MGTMFIFVLASVRRTVHVNSTSLPGSLFFPSPGETRLVLTQIGFLFSSRRFSVKTCASCNQGISSKELVMRAREHVYHISCFSCDRCKRILATGEYFGMHGMQIYCKADYEILLREEANAMKSTLGSSSAKGRPRKKKISIPLEDVTTLSGEALVNNKH